MPDTVFFDTSKHPPQGWVYRERIKGKWFSVSDPMLPFLDVASEIQAWRRNNGVDSKLSSCVTALKRHTMLRLGINPDKGPATIEQQVVAAESGSGCCGRKRL